LARKNGITTNEGKNTEGEFMSGEPVDTGEFDFLGAEDHFTSNIDTENHLRFFVDTLAILRQKGEEQAVSSGMTQNHLQAMNRLAQTHSRMLQHFQEQQQTGGMI